MVGVVGYESNSTFTVHPGTRKCLVTINIKLYHLLELNILYPVDGFKEAATIHRNNSSQLWSFVSRCRAPELLWQSSHLRLVGFSHLLIAFKRSWRKSANS